MSVGGMRGGITEARAAAAGGLVTHSLPAMSSIVLGCGAFES